MSVKSRTSASESPEYWLPCRTCQNQPIVCDRIGGRTPIALILDFPTNLERARGQLLQGDTGKLIRATLKAIDVDQRDVNVVTALNCKPNTAKPKLLRESMACCRARLLRELRSIDAEKVLCLGTIGYTALTSTDKIARMDKMHCRWMPVYGMWMIGTYSPTRVIMDPELYRDWIRAFNKFFTTDKREYWPHIRTTTPQSVKHLQKEMQHIGAFNTDHQLSLDIETTGFSPIDDEIVAVGFGSMVNETAGDAVTIDYEMLQDERVWWTIADQLEFGWNVLHNGKFDLKFLTQVFRKLDIDYRIGKLDDTMLLNYSLDERPWGKYGAHSLKNISRVRYDAPDYGIDVGRWIKEWKEAVAADDHSRKQELEKELHIYLTLDCYYTARLGRDLRIEVAEESELLFDCYERLLIPASNALSAIELRGCKIDVPYLKSLHTQFENELQKSTDVIRGIVGHNDFNPGSNKQLYKLFYEELKFPVVRIEQHGKVKDGPTSQAAIRRLRSGYPRYEALFDEILHWRKTQKTLGTYIRGLLDRVEVDDRIRCDFLLHGTVTGRLSSINPNLQNIPERSHTGVDLRAAFIPTDDDWVFIEADYSQLELRVAAHISNDPNLTQVYVENKDLHQQVLTRVFNRAKPTQYDRRLAKGMVFGALYDRSPKAMATGAEMDYIVNELGGQAWSLTQMEEFFKAFFSEFKELAKWQKAQRRIGYEAQMVETELGRRRRFPFINSRDGGAVGRQAINTPFQSLASDINLDAMVRIHNRLETINRKAGQVLAHVVLIVHDSIAVEAHKSAAKKVKRIMQEEMENVPIKTRVPFKVNISVGKNWGVLHD